MRNLKRISIILVALMAMLLILGEGVDAVALTLKTTVDKKEAKVGEEIIVTVDWTEGMQAVEFILNYDKEKVEFVSSPFTGTFFEKDDKAGKLQIAWYSDRNEDMTKVDFKFKAKAEGTSNFSVETDGGFADGNVVSPESYDVKTYGTTAVTLKAAAPAATPTPTPAATQKPATPTPAATAKAPTVLPKAGNGLNVLVAIPVLLAVTVVAYIQIRKYGEI